MMRSSLVGVEAKYADAIAAAVLDELGPYGIDESRVELAGHADADVSRVLSVGVVVDGAESSPMLIETQAFKTSLEEQMDLLRAWLRAGHPSQVVSSPIVQYKTGDRVPAPDATEPLVAARDSCSSRVWVVSERAAQDPSAELVPYLIFPDGSLIREQQHGLPD
jgi:hypothetical protein